MSAILFNNQEQQQHHQQLIMSKDPLKSVYAEQTPTPQPNSVASYGARNGHCSTAATDDICEEVLGQKMTALELHDVAVCRLSQQHHQQQLHNCGEGSDSGVEIVATSSCVNVTTLQRALSSNSGGYASSSNGGLDETTHGLNMSCDSSMLSCASDLYEIKMVASAGGAGLTRNNYECCSENGSESSSVAAGPTAAAAAVVAATRRSINSNNSSGQELPEFDCAVGGCCAVFRNICPVAEDSTAPFRLHHRQRNAVLTLQSTQENRLLQTKYAALEAKSKELIVQQNCSVSGASAALSGLQTRLDSLVEQLVSSYSISERDLEDIVFQNESALANCGGQFSNDSSNDCREASNQTTTKSTSLATTANGLDLPLQLHAQLPQLSSEGSLSPQRNQSFIAAVISAIRNATTPAGKRLLTRNVSGGGKQRSSAGGHYHRNHLNQNINNNNHNEQAQASNADDSDDSTEMLDSETEPCLMMDNVLEDVTMPDSHSHNMVSSSTTAAGGGGAGTVSQIELPSSEVANGSNGCDESLQNLSQAITNRQQMELHVNALSSVQKVSASLQLNPHHCDNNSITEDVSCHDSVAEMPSLAVEYYCTQAVVDQVIEVDSLVTKLLKVLRLIQMDNDNCIQQLIVDKNKLQQNKEDILEKLKDLQDINVKLQDELMDATQELMLKNNDLSSTKTEIQRHRNEIDRLTEDICNLSTLCSNYKKLSPSTEFPPFPSIYQHQLCTRAVPAGAGDDDAAGILNLLRMWQAEGQLKDNRVRHFLSSIETQQKSHPHDNGERLRIYANQLENVLSILAGCGDDVTQNYPALHHLRRDIEIVKRNADWAQWLVVNSCGVAGTDSKVSASSCGEDMNANDAEVDSLMTRLDTHKNNISKK